MSKRVLHGGAVERDAEDVLKSSVVTDPIRQTAERHAARDRAIEVAKVAAPIYAAQMLSPEFLKVLNRKLGREAEPEDLMSWVVQQARALIAEAERQEGE